MRDPATRRPILQRLLWVESGHYGDFKAVGDRVNELRFFFGAGYRVIVTVAVTGRRMDIGDAGIKGGVDGGNKKDRHL